MKRLIPEIIEPWFFIPSKDIAYKVANDYAKPQHGLGSILKKLFKLKSKHVDHTI